MQMNCICSSLLLLTLLLLVSFSVALIGRDQSAGVRGILMCHGRPAANVRVKLYDDDTGPDLDDLLEAGVTDVNGRFQLQGTTDEIMTIDPKLNIYHDCDDGIMPCQRRITIDIPSSYVSSGTIPQRVYDAGSIELAGKFSGEERDCFNRRM